MEQPYVSIILTSYNFERYIEQAILSLLNQTLKAQVEIIIIDDASKDNSASIIKQFEAVNKNIVFIHHTINKGAAYSINEAFKLANGKYLCRFDGDDVWDSNFLEKMTDILEQHPTVALAYCNCSYVNSEGKVTNKDVLTRRKTNKTIAYEFEDLLADYYITAPTILFRKNILDSIFPVPEKYNFLDWYLSLSASLKHPFYFLNETLAFYRVHDEGMHVQMIANKKGEETTFDILNHFRNINAISAVRLKELTAISNKKFAFSYFGQNLFKDARRCMINYLKNDFSALTDLQMSRLFIGSYLGKVYPKIKNILKK